MDDSTAIFTMCGYPGGGERLPVAELLSNLLIFLCALMGHLALHLLGIVVMSFLNVMFKS